MAKRLYSRVVSNECESDSECEVSKHENFLNYSWLANYQEEEEDVAFQKALSQSQVMLLIEGSFNLYFKM